MHVLLKMPMQNAHALVLKDLNIPGLLHTKAYYSLTTWASMQADGAFVRLFMTTHVSI